MIIAITTTLLLLGWHYLSNATCLMRPRLFYAFFAASRISIICYIMYRCVCVNKTSLLREPAAFPHDKHMLVVTPGLSSGARRPAARGGRWTCSRCPAPHMRRGMSTCWGKGSVCSLCVKGALGMVPLGMDLTYSHSSYQDPTDQDPLSLNTEHIALRN